VQYPSGGWIETSSTAAGLRGAPLRYRPSTETTADQPHVVSGEDQEKNWRVPSRQDTLRLFFRMEQAVYGLGGRTLHNVLTHRHERLFL